MQKFAPSASRLPQDGQKFRGGAAARDTDDATTDAVTGSAVGGVTRTPSSGCDGEAGSPPAPQPNQPRAAGAGGAWGATGAGGEPAARPPRSQQAPTPAQTRQGPRQQAQRAWTAEADGSVQQRLLREYFAGSTSGTGASRAAGDDVGASRSG